MECRRVLIYLCTLIRCWCTDLPWARLFLLFTTRLLTSLPAPECFLFSIFILAQWALKHGYKQNVFTLTVVNCLCRFYKHVLCSGSINQRFPSSPTFPCYIRDTIRCRLMYVLCSFFDGAQMPPCNQVAVCIHVCLDTYNTANVVKTLREISKIVLIAVLSKWYFWLIIDMHRFVSATKDLFNQQFSRRWVSPIRHLIKCEIRSQFPLLKYNVHKNGMDGSEVTMTLTLDNCSKFEEITSKCS